MSDRRSLDTHQTAIDQPPPGLLQQGAVAVPLTHNKANAATGGIWRVTAGPGPHILKIATPAGTRVGVHWPTSDDERHWNYWKREVLAYRTGLAATAYADGGLRAPRLLDSRDLPDGSVALWLEAVDGLPGGGWSVARYADFATRLGAGQARWLDARPAYPWLSRGWLRQYHDFRSPPIGLAAAGAGEFWDHPTIAAVWPAALRAGLDRLARNSGALVAIVERLPRTLAHLDVWPANLLWAPGRPTLLDWSFVGDGAAGEDIGNLVVDAVADGHVDIDLMPALTEAVTDGYLNGLDGVLDRDDVVRAIRASAAAKYAWFGPRAVERVVADAPLGSSFYDVGGGVAEKLTRWRPMLEMLSGWTADLLDA